LSFKKLVFFSPVICWPVDQLCSGHWDAKYYVLQSNRNTARDARMFTL